jgi:predicted acyltransferase
MLIASVSVNSLIATAPWFDHAVWASVHPIDVIFPLFVTLSGCGLAFAMRNTVKVGPLLRRVVVLLIVGLLYNAVVSNVWNWDDWRLTGVLQLYAVVVLVMGLLHLVTRSWVGWVVITVVLSAAHTTLLAVYATACPSGLLTRQCNPSGPIDVFVFGTSHIYSSGLAGHDPEGLVAIFGALVSASAGATVGHLLLSMRDRARQIRSGPEIATVPLLVAAFGFLLLSRVVSAAPELAGGVAIPAMKRLWTAPFALEVAAVGAVLLLIGHLLLDRQDVGRARSVFSYPLLALGRNSLLVYFGSHVLMSLLDRPFAGGPSIAERVTTQLDLYVDGQLVWTVGLLFFWIGLACLLHRYKIYVRP